MTVTTVTKRAGHAVHYDRSKILKIGRAHV